MEYLEAMFHLADPSASGIPMNTDAFSPSPDIHPMPLTHGLWSLWDIMHKIDSAKFFKALEQACTTHQAFAMLPHLAGAGLYEKDYAEKARQFGELADECVALGLSGAAASIRRAIVIWDEAKVVGADGARTFEFDHTQVGRIRTALSQATSRIPDDLEQHVLLALDGRRQHLFSDLRPFGDEVFSAFPAARSDIEEAAKCLAVERGTASVFHIMRALESAAGVIATKIGAAVVDQHGRGLAWGVIAENMKPKIDAMARGSEEQIKWYRVQNELVVVNRAWRVPTNHPKESYLPDEAQDVFDATKTFMQDLAALV